MQNTLFGGKYFYDKWLRVFFARQCCLWIPDSSSFNYRVKCLIKPQTKTPSLWLHLKLTLNRIDLNERGSKLSYIFRISCSYSDLKPGNPRSVLQISRLSNLKTNGRRKQPSLLVAADNFRRVLWEIFRLPSFVTLSYGHWA